MKFVCDRDKLSKMITTASRAVSTKSALGILECLLIIAEDSSVRVIGNDLELGIETRPMEAEVLEEGCVALEARMISDIVRRLPVESVRFESDSNNVTVIKSGRSEFRVVGQNGDEFTFLPEVGRESSFNIPAAELERMIHSTLFCVGQDESKPVMMGLLVDILAEETRIVAIDGFRIAVASAPNGGAEEAKIVIPQKAMAEIARIIAGRDEENVTISYSKRHVMFETAESVVVTRLIDGEFMKYEPVFDQNFTAVVTAGRSEFMECLDRAALISKDGRKNPVKLTIGEGRIEASSKTQFGASFEEVGCELDGAAMEIAFNPRFFIDALRVINDDSVIIKFSNPLSPCVITGAQEEGYKYLALPLRIR